jgi:hypothetical protein
MRLLICGDRDWDDKELIKKMVLELRPTVIIDGAAPGADELAAEVAKELGIALEEYPADWEGLGTKAGPIRNTQMLVEGKPELVLAFHDYLETSKGTKDMVRKASVAGVSIIFIKHDEPPHMAQVREFYKKYGQT